MHFDVELFELLIELVGLCTMGKNSQKEGEEYEEIEEGVGNEGWTSKIVEVHFHQDDLDADVGKLEGHDRNNCLSKSLPSCNVGTVNVLKNGNHLEAAR